MEKYNLEHWRAVPDRSRGTWARPAAKFKREFAGYINRARDLTATDKLVGRLLVDYYNEKYGCAWPSTKTIAEDTGASVRAVNKATNTLHETGLIHKVIGGGWDRTKIRHVPNRYYPAFSLITNGDGGLVKNGSELSGNPPETRSNAGAPPAGSASPQDLRVSKSENRQFSKGTPRNSCTPYSDNGMATAIASPVPADASTGSLAPAPEFEPTKWVISTDAETVSRILNIPIPEFLAAMAGWSDTGVSAGLRASCYAHIQYCLIGGAGKDQEGFKILIEDEDEDGQEGKPSEQPSAIIELKHGEPMTAEGKLDLDPGERIWIRFPLSWID